MLRCDHAQNENGVETGNKKKRSLQKKLKNIDLIHLLCAKMDLALGRKCGSSEMLITYVKDRPGHDFRYALNSRKISKNLGWKSKIKLEKGLKETIDWYLNNIEFITSISRKLYQRRLGLKL